MDDLFATAHDYDRDEYNGGAANLPVQDLVSRDLFAHAKSKGSRVIFLSENN